MKTASFQIELSFVSDGSPESFEELLDGTLDELEALGYAADVTASLARKTASFNLPVDSLSSDALIESLTALRAALHAAGCSTAEWPYEVTATRTADLQRA